MRPPKPLTVADTVLAPVPLDKAFRLINHGPVVLVSSAHGAARNVMAAAWAMPLDFSPPKVAVVVDARSYTRELIEASGEFAFNIPCRNQIEAVLKAGTATGRDGDKFDTVRNSLTAVSYGERDPDCAAIASPVFGADQRLIGALSVSGPKLRFTPDNVALMSRHVREAATTITRALGGRELPSGIRVAR